MFKLGKKGAAQRAPAEQGGFAEQLVLIVWDSRDAYSEKTYRNACAALEYAHVRCAGFDLGGSRHAPSLSDYSCVFLCAERLQQCSWPLLQELRRLVSSGGGLAVLFRGWNRHLSDILGVDCDDEWPVFRQGAPGGLKFVSDLLPALNGLELSDDDVSGHTPYDFAPGEDATVLVRDSADRPLAWLSAFQKGRAVFWNTSVLAHKDMRGLIVQSLALVQSVSVTASVNVGLIQVDDFPPPLMSELPAAFAEANPGLTPIAFYRDVWLADMIELAHRHALRYSCFAIDDYDAGIDTGRNGGHSDEAEGRLGKRLARYSESLAGAEGAIAEIGLHGHNHTPPLLSNWKTRDAMLAGFKACRAQWQAHAGLEPPVSYVPPNNEYDRDGLEALCAAFPEIEAVCGLYTAGRFEAGGDREFGPEPWNHRLFCIPRMSSGFDMPAFTRFQAISQLLTMGAWTHFFHPDDVFDVEDDSEAREGLRNVDNRPWRANPECGEQGLFDRFSDWLHALRAQFPWLRFCSTREALERFRAFQDARMTVHFGPSGVAASCTGPLLVHLRVNDLRQVNPVSVENAEIVHISKGADFTTYTLQTSDAGPVKIELM
ncbi:DUF2194 domain-containing protein [Hoeflea poritis]|uniref:DUF2194 domain-containing protein n=1 Tax=Hoeflea poritis TaxID=2993659 RepID=A0ABT4VQQ5_9HYPH|nr:DUF2194 domain-containing protein [Hoeflea poritis]MDA4847039.1 DUF2194 domain-containing protein [Hoeflea poritis]